MGRNVKELKYIQCLEAFARSHRKERNLICDEKRE